MAPTGWVGVDRTNKYVFLENGTVGLYDSVSMCAVLYAVLFAVPRRGVLSKPIIWFFATSELSKVGCMNCAMCSHIKSGVMCAVQPHKAVFRAL